MFSFVTSLVRRAPFFLAIALLFSGVAFGEPYLAIYKGMQCSSCHSQQAGGGKRNVYGNAFAQTELPAQRIGEGDLWTGEITKSLSIGADLRASYQNVDAPNSPETSEFSVNRGTVYLEASLVQNRLYLYVDQQLAPGASVNREAYLKLLSASGKVQFLAGQFFLPYGLRLQDDTAFVRQATGINFTNPDRGLQVAYQTDQWSSQVSVTNGSGGGVETDTGKQISFVTSYIRPLWRVGASLNYNDDDLGDRQMQNIFFGLKTGRLVWLAEIDLITDDLPGGFEQDATAGLIEANWPARQGHNLKVSFDFFDPNEDLGADRQTRYSLVWEYMPMQFLQGRFGARIYDGVVQIDFQNRDEFFAEIHGFF
ncbi:MAG: hypothetical protein O3A13_05550 [Proteobacteria bacterium]|nr:hypothetical protein [Pseudomonadota bacterium]